MTENKFIQEAREELEESVVLGGLLCKIPKFPETVRRFPHSDGRYYFTVDSEPFVYHGITGYIDKIPTLPSERIAIDLFKTKHGKDYSDELNKTSIFGTFGHIACAEFVSTGIFQWNELRTSFEQYCIATGLPMIQFGKYWHRMVKNLRSFAQFCHEKEVEPLAVEYPVYSKDLGVATCLDLICDLKFNRSKVRSNINFKFRENPGTYSKDAAQVFLEMHLMNLHYQGTENEIKMGFIWMPKDYRNETPTYDLVNLTGKYTQKEWELDHQYITSKGFFKKVDVDAQYLRPNGGDDVYFGQPAITTKETLAEFCLKFKKD